MLRVTQILCNITLKDGSHVFTDDLIHKISHYLLKLFNFSFKHIIKSNNLDILKWHIANTNTWDTIEIRKFGMRRIAAIGNIEMLKWMSHNPIYEGTNAIDFAAMSARRSHKASSAGHLDVIKWLHKNRSERCSTLAMNSAAAHGCLDIVIWLHENRSEGCTKHAMNSAARYGHLEVVKWLYVNRNEASLMCALAEAAQQNHIEVCEFLKEHLDWSQFEIPTLNL